MNYLIKRIKKKQESTNKYLLRFFASKNVLLPFLMISCSLLFFGCVSTNLSFGPVKRILKIENLEVKPIDLPTGTNPAFKYWVKRGDLVSVEWEKFTLVTQQEDSQTFCTIENSPNEGCRKENLCSEGSEIDVENFEVSLKVDTDFLRIDGGDVVLNLTDAVEERKACKNVNKARPKFAVEKSGVYRLSINPFTPTNFPDANMGEAEIYVIDSSESPQQIVSYNLRKERIDSTDFWRWEMPAAVFWSDNFSKNVRVKDVRILNNDRELKPSRLILLSGYNGTVINHLEYQDSSCFSNPNMSQVKKIDLTKCRKQYTSNAQIENKKVTPTYIHSNDSKKLYWFAEFDTNKGADDVSTISELDIEFTLEAAN